MSITKRKTEIEIFKDRTIIFTDRNRNSFKFSINLKDLKEWFEELDKSSAVSHKYIEKDT